MIICTYNRCKLITRAVDSLIGQTEPDWEAIIVDDGSTDGTFQTVRKYTDKHPNIRYMYHSNRGPGQSKTAGILAASGVYITFLDSDDEYRDSHLEFRKNLIIQNPDIGLIHGGCRIIGSPYVPDVNNPGVMIHLDECAIGGTFVFRRELAVELGGFSDRRFGDDADFFDRVDSNGYSIGKTEEPTYIYHRDTEDSLCNLADRGMIEL